MIKIYISSNTDKNISPEIDLSGNEEEFSNLNKKLQEFLKSGSQQIKIKADVEINPSPYEKMLENLIVSKNNNRVLISLDEHNLLVQGSVNCLDSFVSNIEFVRNGYHIHYEYYEGNELISPDSIPLVISSRINC